MKLSLVNEIKEDSFNKIKEYKVLKKIGFVLLSLDLILIGIIVLIHKQNRIISYPGSMIYIIAIYDFYLIISALIKVLKYKKYQSPIISASKCINLTVAMISIISLEVSMIYEFGNNDISLRNTIISITGFFVAVINSFMSIYMIISANRQNRISQND